MYHGAHIPRRKDEQKPQGKHLRNQRASRIALAKERTSPENPENEARMLAYAELHRTQLTNQLAHEVGVPVKKIRKKDLVEMMHRKLKREAEEREAEEKELALAASTA